MNLAVWKYELQLIDSPQAIHCGKIVAVAEQNGRLCFWAENQPHTLHHLIVLGTGHSIPDGAVHVGTAHMPPFVWHVYEVPAAKGN